MSSGFAPPSGRGAFAFWRGESRRDKGFDALTLAVNDHRDRVSEVQVDQVAQVTTVVDRATIHFPNDVVGSQSGGLGR